LKSKKPKQHDNKLNMACLARSFYPENISLDVPESVVLYDLKAPLVTSGGMYSTMKVVGVEPDAEATCKAMHKGNRSKASTILPGTVLVGLYQDDTFFPLHLFKANSKMEKTNTLFMAVLGLRVLLAKSIIFNALMSIKLFLF
ncbi:TRDC protein, partial [Tachuris rubrigastra]|nr:TRDC protein [Tachuris rubrigastra]